MIEEKVALVTGAAKGIGYTIALELSKNGYVVVVNDIVDTTIFKKVIKDIGGKSIFYRADISISSERFNMVKAVKEKFGRIDLLVNNAGVAPIERKDILEASEESFDRLIKINLKGPYFLTQLAANWMIELKKKNKKIIPQIINISSISAYTSSPSRGDYCISKAGISMLTKLYADRLSGFGIPVFEIRPGIVATDMTSKVKDKYDKLISSGLTPIKRWGVPEDVAKAVIAIAKGYFPFSTGQIINVDGGFHIKRL